MCLFYLKPNYIPYPNGFPKSMYNIPFLQNMGRIPRDDTILKDYSKMTLMVLCTFYLQLTQILKLFTIRLF